MSQNSLQQVTKKTEQLQLVDIQAAIFKNQEQKVDEYRKLMAKAEEEKDALRQQKQSDMQWYLRKFEEVKNKNQMIEQELRGYKAKDLKAEANVAAL